MNIEKVKLAGYLTLVIGAAVGGGYVWARMVHMPPMVEIGSTACGVPTSSARFGVPLQTIFEAAGGLSFGVGPVEMPEGGEPVRLRFETSIDGQASEVRLIDDVLYLPIAFGPDQRPPRRITLHCREGVLGSVRYQGDGRESATFGVMRAAAVPPTLESSDPPGAADATRPTPTVGY